MELPQVLMVLALDGCREVFMSSASRDHGIAGTVAADIISGPPTFMIITPHLDGGQRRCREVVGVTCRVDTDTVGSPLTGCLQSL